MNRSLLLAAAVVLTACGGAQKYALTPTDKGAGADGFVTATTSEPQHMTKVDIEVKNLLPPERVTPASTHFVAWYRKDDSGHWVRLGALDYNTDDRKGKIVGASAPETQFDVAITAEKTPAPVTPSEGMVMRQRVAP
jgi:hypothetical protein